MLTRTFIEFCILGTDNLPRTLLMYLANMPYPFPNYFPTILCNTDKFKRTDINHSLQVEMPLRQSSSLTIRYSTISTEFLKRKPGRVVQGGWCVGVPKNDTCSLWGDADILRPGPGAKRLEKRIVGLLSDTRFRSRQCPDE
ncbi:Hydroxyethylthiazole kinase family protein [Hibiscus syriacus]|uniref:Hydroxyethylthiazole kinase family protein n=1 Tax=Hibiscus syriacus TaxID=106335 RepID=A0A6A3BSG6_HIBSY|nr:Hydroxyethylthiazole kinase family protein [Hibiscus syriacus]